MNQEWSDTESSDEEVELVQPNRDFPISDEDNSEEEYEDEEFDMYELAKKTTNNMTDDFFIKEEVKVIDKLVTSVIPVLPVSPIITNKPLIKRKFNPRLPPPNKYNKKNDKRKAISTFLSNLVINGVVETEKVFEIISYLQKTIIEYMEMENRSNEIEEITENMYLFITILNESCKQHDQWRLIIDTVQRFSKLKVKEKKSLSSRAIFKYMDILEAIEKQ